MDKLLQKFADAEIKYVAANLKSFEEGGQYENFNKGIPPGQTRKAGNISD